MSTTKGNYILPSSIFSYRCLERFANGGLLASITTGRTSYGWLPRFMTSSILPKPILSFRLHFTSKRAFQTSMWKRILIFQYDCPFFSWRSGDLWILLCSSHSGNLCPWNRQIRSSPELDFIDTIRDASVLLSPACAGVLSTVVSLCTSAHCTVIRSAACWSAAWLSSHLATACHHFNDSSMSDPWPISNSVTFAQNGTWDSTWPRITIATAEQQRLHAL